MEPGHEDREYLPKHIKVPAELREPQWSPVMKTGNTIVLSCRKDSVFMPQWSPVMKTGNTGFPRNFSSRGVAASMEPGHEDREYAPT